MYVHIAFIDTTLMWCPHTREAEVAVDSSGTRKVLLQALPHGKLDADALSAKHQYF
jgi:hypothetical protein